MKKILVLGGGEFHDYTGCCEVISGHLRELQPACSVETVIGDLDCLTRPKIDAFDIVVFYWTKDHLTSQQKYDLLEWCAEKGRFVGIHCAATAFQDCPEYEAMLGGRFKKHPPYRKYCISVDINHPAMKQHFEAFQPPADWPNWGQQECWVSDEQFLIHYDRRVNVAASAAFHGEIWPVAWSKPWGAGKVFYLALGHDVAACSGEFFRQMLFAGVNWVSSDEPEPQPVFAV